MASLASVTCSRADNVFRNTITIKTIWRSFLLWVAFRNSIKVRNLIHSQIWMSEIHGYRAASFGIFPLSLSDPLSGDWFFLVFLIRLEIVFLNLFNVFKYLGVLLKKRFRFFWESKFIFHLFVSDPVSFPLLFSRENIEKGIVSFFEVTQILSIRWYHDCLFFFWKLQVLIMHLTFLLLFLEISFNGQTILVRFF